MATGSARDFPTVTPYLLYEDVGEALAWLSNAFGFRERLRFTDEDGIVNHAEMTVGPDGAIMLGHPGPDYRNPATLNGVTVLIHVYVDDVDAHYAHAHARGAVIVREPADEVYGDRRYDAMDPEGHLWSFATAQRDVAPETWGAVRS